MGENTFLLCDSKGRVLLRLLFQTGKEEKQGHITRSSRQKKFTAGALHNLCRAVRQMQAEGGAAEISVLLDPEVQQARRMAHLRPMATWLRPRATPLPTTICCPSSDGGATDPASKPDAGMSRNAPVAESCD